MKNVRLRNILLFAGFFVIAFCMAGGKAMASDVKVETGKRIDYWGFFTHIFYVDGRIAYCLEPEKTPPPDGVYAAELLADTSPVAKALYYAYGNPGYETIKYQLYPDYDSRIGQGDFEDIQYVESHLLVSYFYCGDGAFFGMIDAQDAIEDIKRKAAIIEQAPSIPKAALTLDKSALSAYYDREAKVQRTQSVHLSGDRRNAMVLNLPEHVSLVNETRGISQTGTVRVGAEETFHLQTGVEHYNGEQWDSGDITGEYHQDWRSLILATGGDSQNIGSGQLIMSSAAPVRLSVSWLPAPELKVEKQADRESKVYKVGDTVTYTMEISQQVKDAVAKDVSIRDTIFTEGVKLQKNSVVLMDAGHRVIRDAQIHVQGNTFIIEGGQALAYLLDTEAGERFFVEYQVIITSESVIGREIENEVVVRAVNAPETKDDETVTVEKPKEPQEPEKPEKPKEPEVPEEKPKEPAAVEIPVKKAAVAKTGDEEKLIVLIVSFILSCVGIFTCVRISRKTK